MTERALPSSQDENSLSQGIECRELGLGAHNQDQLHIVVSCNGRGLDFKGPHRRSEGDVAEHTAVQPQPGARESKDSRAQGPGEACEGGICMEGLRISRIGSSTFITPPCGLLTTNRHTFHGL